MTIGGNSIGGMNSPSHQHLSRSNGSNGAQQDQSPASGDRGPAKNMIKGAQKMYESAQEHVERGSSLIPKNGAAISAARDLMKSFASGEITDKNGRISQDALDSMNELFRTLPRRVDDLVTRPPSEKLPGPGHHHGIRTPADDATQTDTAPPDQGHVSDGGNQVAVDVEEGVEIPEGVTPPRFTSVSTETERESFDAPQVNANLTYTDDTTGDAKATQVQEKMGWETTFNGQTDNEFEVEQDGHKFTYRAEFDNGGAWMDGGEFDLSGLTLVGVEPLG